MSRFATFAERDRYLATRIAQDFASPTDTVDLEAESASTFDMLTPTLTADGPTELKGRHVQFISVPFVERRVVAPFTGQGDDVADRAASVEPFDFLTEPGVALHG